MMPKKTKLSAEKTDRATRKQCSSEEKIRIVWEGLCREYIIAEFFRREGITANLYYR